MITNNFYRKITAPLLMILLFSGCAALAVKRDESKGIMTYAYSYDELWDNLLSVIAEKGDTIVSEDKKKGIIFSGN